MKSIKIGKTEYQQLENLFDINDERFVIFKQFLLQVLENIDKPLFDACFAKCKAFYNANQHSDVIIELHNFKEAIKLKELNHDAYSMCFALLHLAKDEDQRNDVNSDFQLKKLEKMRADGLSRGQVEEVVENFMKASPKTFGAYLAVLEMMKPELMAEALKG